jgi:hypothetical protein
MWWGGSTAESGSTAAKTHIFNGRAGSMFSIPVNAYRCWSMPVPRQRCSWAALPLEPDGTERRRRDFRFTYVFRIALRCGRFHRIMLGMTSSRIGTRSRHAAFNCDVFCDLPLDNRDHPVTGASSRS